MWTRDQLLATIDADPDLSRLLAYARAEIDDDPGHDLSHCLRVALWTVAIGGGDIDWREGVASALLHDIINVPKDSPDRARASELCADHARHLLPSFAFDTAAIERICDAIRDHSFSRGAVPTALPR